MTQQVVLFHTHGLGRFDFSDLDDQDLVEINRLAAERQAFLCPTLYLTEDRVEPVERLLRCYSLLGGEEYLERILGFAVEGPVLGPKGGTPRGAVWQPDAACWRRLVEWFPLGLKYIVIAPDVMSLDDEIEPCYLFADLLDAIYDSGGRVALGHFGSDSAETAARRFGDVLDHIEKRFRPSPYLVLTDHLFNDMPRSFQHAFRTSQDRALRDENLAPLISSRWRDSDLADLLGPVPAALLMAARARRLTPALNFDGGHVDLAICKRVVEFLGPDRIIAMTDHTETLMLAGEPLQRDEETRLLYRSDGVLAASSVSHEDQRANMRSIGMSAEAINVVQFETPLAALAFRPCRRTGSASSC